METLEQAIVRQKAQAKAIRNNLSGRSSQKPRLKPRKQAIKEAKAQVLNEAIDAIKDDLRAIKTEEHRRGHYRAISKLSQIRDEL